MYIITRNFSNLIKFINPQIPKAQSSSSTKKEKKKNVNTTPQYIIIKFLKTSDKDTSLKGVLEKKQNFE